jgi:hypothetical protein
MSFPSNIKKYCSWMEQMARDHVLLMHEEGTKNESYQEVWLSGEHFNGIDWRSLLIGLKNKVKYPAMINIGVDFNVPTLSQEGRTVAECRFAIVQKMDNSVPLIESRLACYDVAEGIATDIMLRIEKYFEVNIRWGALIGVAETEPIGPVKIDGDLYGVVCTFKYQSNVTNCYKPSQWATEITIEND